MTSKGKCAAAACVMVLTACGGRKAKPPAAPGPQAASPVSQRQITGRLSDRATSLPLAHVLVRAQADPPGRSLGETWTLADGTYTLASLPVGMTLRVVSQPVAGALVYGTEVGAPLAPGAAPAVVDLAFTQVPLGGAVEGTPVRDGGGHDLPGPITLVQFLDPVKGPAVVVRSRPTGAFRFESLPPGTYEVRYEVTRLLHRHGTVRTPASGPLRARMPMTMHQHFRTPVTVRAGETAQVEAPRLARADEEQGTQAP